MQRLHTHCIVLLGFTSLQQRNRSDRWINKNPAAEWLSAHIEVGWLGAAPTAGNWSTGWPEIEYCVTGNSCPPLVAWLETDRNRSESRSAHSVLPWAVITIFDDLIHSLLPRSQRQLWSPTESKTFAVSHSFPLSGFQLTQGDLTTFQLWLNYWQA